MRAASETHRATRNHADVDKYNRKEKRGLMLFRLLFQLKKEKDQQACNSLQEKKFPVKTVLGIQLVANGRRVGLTL